MITRFRIRAIITFAAIVAAMCVSGTVSSAAPMGSGSTSSVLACSSSSSEQVTGGYKSTLWCPFEGGYYSGFGSNLTAATTEARELHSLYLETDIQCTASSVRKVTGGYDVSLWCTHFRKYIHGQGTTLTDAAIAARLNAAAGW